MSAPTRRNQAAWEKSAVDLSGDLSRAASLGALGLGQVADVTGLSTETISDCMYRPVATDPDNPRTYLCRPRYRVNSTPYWAPEQAEQAAAVAAGRRDKVGRGPEGPMLDPDADVVGIRDIATAAGKHDQTVRKWVNGSYSTGHIETDDDNSVGEPFPGAIGRRPQPDGLRRGNPETVYDRAAVHRWVQTEIGVDLAELATAEAAAALHGRVVEARLTAARERAAARAATSVRAS